MLSPELKAELDLLLEAASQELAEGLRKVLTAQAILDTPPLERLFTLLKPVTFADQEYASVTLREPTAAEIDDIERSATPAMTAISTIGAIPMGAVKKLCARDYNAMRTYTIYFLNESAPVTGS